MIQYVLYFTDCNSKNLFDISLVLCERHFLNGRLISPFDYRVVIFGDWALFELGPILSDQINKISPKIVLRLISFFFQEKKFLIKMWSIWAAVVATVMADCTRKFTVEHDGQVEFYFFLGLSRNSNSDKASSMTRIILLYGLVATQDLELL